MKITYEKRHPDLITPYNLRHGQSMLVDAKASGLNSGGNVSTNDRAIIVRVHASFILVRADGSCDIHKDLGLHLRGTRCELELIVR